MQIAIAADGAVSIAPVTAALAAALAAEMGATSPDDGLRFDGVETLHAPSRFASAAAGAVKKLASEGK